MSPTEIILAIIVVVTFCGMAWFGYHLITQNGRLMLRVESLERRLVEQGVLAEGVDPNSLGRPPGSVLNDFALPLLGGGTMTLSQWRGRKVALLFLSPHCEHCAKLLPELAELLAQSTEADPAPVIVSTGGGEENQRFFGKRGITCPVVLQEDSELAALYLAMVTPMAYLVDERGATLGRAVVGAAAIMSLLRDGGRAADAAASDHSQAGSHPSLASSRINRDGLKAGTPAPDFALPGLDGNAIALNSFRGRPVLLVFSDPNCKPCNELLPKLEEIHQKSKDLRVLVIGRGDPEANRDKAQKLGLTLPMVLQRSWEVSRTYGMFATPIGYLVGEDGVLAEDVAVGGNRILAMAAQGRDASVRAGK